MNVIGSQEKNCLRHVLLRRYQDTIKRDNLIDRKLVSFQANRRSPILNWFKFREGFSADLVGYLIENNSKSPGTLLDPFAGSGTSLAVGKARGWWSQGIELMPIGPFILKARMASAVVSLKKFREALEKTKGVPWLDFYDDEFAMNHIPITEGAFSRKTEKEIAGFRSFCRSNISDRNIRALFDFGCFSVLESVSYTRKDGQYLRWDRRAGKGRKSGSSFHKGSIPSFDRAIAEKLNAIYLDIECERTCETPLFSCLSSQPDDGGSAQVRMGSCLDLLPLMEEESIDLIITSPPYCNRYDYTRTYALELVYLGLDDREVKTLRQSMLSCTVENRTKEVEIESSYMEKGQQKVYQQIVTVFRKQAALHEVLSVLDHLNGCGLLNNSNVPRMIRNYFFEMCFVIYEMARILKRGGRVAMVNDNVQYAGEEIPVDLILSDMANSFGLRVERIWTLSKGKGNSSQQMGVHGRSELRKCVYVWEKN